jgi:quinol monooxygenase YgiN
VSELNFSSYMDRFKGQTGWVVGRGRTLFDYGCLASVRGPIFFVNDAVSQECHLSDEQPSFFFAHDASMAKWLSLISSISVIVMDHPRAGPNGEGLIQGIDDPNLKRARQAILYYQHGEFEQETILSRSRDEIARARQLCIRSGTIHPLFHFAWYTGCAELNLVGCDGLPNSSYDERLPNLSASTQQGAFTIRQEQEEILSALELPANYLGTPPHTIRLECSLTILPGQRAILIHLSHELLSRAEVTTGCLSAALEETDAAQNVFELSFEWNEISGLLHFLKTPELLRFQAIAVERVLATEPSFNLHTRLR